MIGHNEDIQKKYKIILSIILFSIVLLILSLFIWEEIVFDADTEALLYTLNSDLKGADMSYYVSIIPLPFVCVVLMTVGIIFSKRISNKLSNHIMNIILMTSFIALVGVILFIVNDLGLFKLNSKKNYSEVESFISENYVKPDYKNIVVPKNKKNLVLIYLESMENRYIDIEDNLIPNLTQYAEDNINFSENDGVGGAYAMEGTRWTMASLFCTSSGVPFKFPIERDELALQNEFAPNIVCLGDILNHYGYNQEFLCGSDASFGGRKIFYEQHGNYNIYDYYTARDAGYFDLTHKVWWGMEDYYLYEVAKDELLRLSQLNEPFNLTMLTVDTHNVGGYFCDYCNNEYDDNISNVISCADRQVYGFIEWIKQQDFYEDTVIIILGDHPRLDNQLVWKFDYADRTVYNCFINSTVTDKSREKNRTFTEMDIFPTILVSMGFDIKGNRLGTGVNLFSQTETLLEKEGREKLEQNFEGVSDYYAQNFMPNSQTSTHLQ